MNVGATPFPILRSYADDLAVAELHREDECLDTGDGFEDSDYEDGPELVGGHASETQDGGKEKVELEPRPTLTVGSFNRYVH